MNEFNELLNVPDNFALCDGVFSRFAEAKNEIDVESYEIPERIVTLVWHSSGIIGNGGFHYLLEGDFNGDPGFVLTAAAYKAIGADDCYKCFQDVLRIFPEGHPPADIGERLKLYEAVPKDERWSIDCHFFKELNQKKIERLLAKYIRKNKKEISRLLKPISNC